MIEIKGKLTAERIFYTIGKWYGRCWKENGKYVIWTVDGTYSYDTAEEGILDWLDTMYCSNHDVAADGGKIWSDEIIAFAEELENESIRLFEEKEGTKI